MDEANLLKNITVLSLEQATVLPYLTLRLSEDGANVIRMEHPIYGDPNRRIGDDVLKEDRMFSYYLSINAGKKGLTLDLATQEGQKILKQLILKLKVDIFATNQLPRNYSKLGIEYEMLKKIKEDIIWLGMTGFGPQSNEAAYDPVLQARGGLMELTGEKGGTPQVMGIPLPDMGASEHMFTGTHVGKRDAHHLRCSSLFSSKLHQSPSGLEHRIISRLIALWPKTSHPQPDDIFLDLFEHLVFDSKFGIISGQLIGRKDIHLQFEDELL